MRFETRSLFLLAALVAAGAAISTDGTDDGTNIGTHDGARDGTDEDNNVGTAWHPPRLNYQHLLSEEVLVINGLDEVLTSSLIQEGSPGLLSLTNVFPREKKRALYGAMFDCYHSTMDYGGTEANGAKTVTFPDGTRRTTWAADWNTKLDACPSLVEAVEPIRDLMGEAMLRVVQRLERSMGIADGADGTGGAMRVPSMDSEEEYSFQELVSEGNHLDHFHVYAANSGGEANTELQLQHHQQHQQHKQHQQHIEEEKVTENTIDWHTDYGWALAFLPGQMIDIHKGWDYVPSRGFYVQLSNGEQTQVHFEREDDIVIMLGDGVSHLNHYAGNHNGLRSVPHSFVMPSVTTLANEDEQSEQSEHLRLWYGRMMLFPSNAIHSTLGKTFGEVQRLMNEHPSYVLHKDHRNDKDDGVDDSYGSIGSYSFGCSNPLNDLSLLIEGDQHTQHTQSVQLVPRLLADETITCTSSQFFCWHACYNHTEDLSPEACAERELELACVSSEDGSLWDGTHNKAFGPECVDVSLLSDGSESGAGEGGGENVTSGEGAENVTENVTGTEGGEEEGSGENVTGTGEGEEGSGAIGFHRLWYLHGFVWSALLFAAVF